MSDNEKKPVQFLFHGFTILPCPDWLIEKMTKTTSAIVGRDIDADSLIRIGELLTHILSRSNLKEIKQIRCGVAFYGV